MKKLILATASALTLAACQVSPTYPVAPPPSGVQQPAPPVNPPAPPPAGNAGPLTQAGVGKYMDGLEADLRLRLRGQGVVVIRRGNDMLLVMPDAGLFTGETVSGPGTALLGTVALSLRYYDHTLMQIDGYTDTVGSDVQNLTVSQQRADAVMHALIQDGIAAARLEAHGFGATDLRIATGPDTAEPRNRRIEVHILPRPQ